MIAVSLLVEGESDAPIAARVLSEAGAIPGHLVVKGGKANLDVKLPGINRAARRDHPWFVLRDLDHDDAGCPPDLVSRLLRGAPLSTGLVLRFAVRAIESWILADRAGFARFAGVSRSRIGVHPDDFDDPKEALITICRSSTLREIREGIVPRERSGRRVGPRYVELLGTFAQTKWSIAAARESSPSLGRGLDRLTERIKEWSEPT